MSAKYSLIYLTAGGRSPVDMLYLAAEAGYDLISPRTIPMGLAGEPRYDLAGDRTLFAATERAIAETGVGIDAIENARIFDGVDIAAYEPALEAAAQLGVRHVLCNIWTEDQAQYTGKFAQLCALADRYGQTVDIEFVTWASVWDLNTCIALLDAVDCDNGRVIVDALHFYRSRQSLEELRAVPARRLASVHLCDSPEEIPQAHEALAYTAREARLFPGEGAAPVRALVELMPEAVRGIEIPHLARMEAMGIQAYVEQALLKTKAYLGEA